MLISSDPADIQLNTCTTVPSVACPCEMKTRTDTMNEAKTTPDPIMVVAVFDNFFPKKTRIKNPSNGKRGTSVTNFSMTIPSIG